MKWTTILILALLSPYAFADDCQIDWWKRNKIDIHNVTYSGAIKQGTANTIFIEVWTSSKGMIGEGWSYVNPRGAFMITVSSKHWLKKSANLVFSCTMDKMLNNNK